MWADGLRPGRYDRVVDRRLGALLAQLADRVHLSDLEPSEQPRRLASHVAGVLARVLGAADEGERLEIGNALVSHLDEADAGVPAPPQLLEAVTPNSLARLLRRRGVDRRGGQRRGGGVDACRSRSALGPGFTP